MLYFFIFLRGDPSQTILLPLRGCPPLAVQNCVWRNATLLTVQRSSTFSRKCKADRRPICEHVRTVLFSDLDEALIPSPRPPTGYSVGAGHFTNPSTIEIAAGAPQHEQTGKVSVNSASSLPSFLLRHPREGKAEAMLSFLG